MKLNNKPVFLFFLLALGLGGCGTGGKKNTEARTWTKPEVVEVIRKVNLRWQQQNPRPASAFWHPAAYHTGNMAAYEVTGDTTFLNYSEAWAEKNHWQGATGTDKDMWRYDYGETPDHVLFGDWQICFQTYIDLYNIAPADYKIARAREVMEYEMSTPHNDYWWWADGLYMVMPVMTKLYHATGNMLYLDKLYEYFTYSCGLMYDKDSALFFRDGKYVYPAHKTRNGKKDFWSRGNGWAFAALARILKDLPDTDPRRGTYLSIYRQMAASLSRCQRSEGYWSRSLLDEPHAPGRETSGTAFFTYGYLWGINNGLLDAETYLPVVRKAWTYLTTIALQPDGTIGYVQPIGERADQHADVGARTTADFGVGAFLLAAAEMAKYAQSVEDTVKGTGRE